MTVGTGFSRAGAESLPLSSTVLGARPGAGVTSAVSEVAASALAVVVRGSEGGSPTGGREDSSSPELAVEGPSGTKGKDGRNSDGTGRGAMPGSLWGVKEGRGGKPRTERAQDHESSPHSKSGCQQL